MKIKDIIKKQTTIIALAVVAVAITAIGVSYAIFFDVKTNSNNQVITAGTLQLTIADFNSLVVDTPMGSEDGLKSAPVSYTPNNTGNLPASYSIYVYADTSNNIDLSKVKVSLDGNATSGATSKSLTEITDTFTEDGKTYFKINSGTLAAGATGTTGFIRVWVDEDLMGDVADDVTVSLYMYITSEVQE